MGSEIIERIWRDVHRNMLAAEAIAAKRDPVAHKLTRVMEKPMTYRYYRQLGTRRGRIVRWCWTCHRNVAGYFLAWREVETKDEVVRDRWIANRVRKRLQERSRRMAGR